MVDSGWTPAYQRPGADPCPPAVPSHHFSDLRSDRDGGGLAVGAAARLIAAGAGAAVWTVVVGLTGYGIGFAAVGLGLLVGQAIAVTNRANARLPLLAAGLALFSCLLGDLFVDAHLLAAASGLGLPTVLQKLITHPQLMVRVFKAGFSLPDIAFWMIAAVAGYRLA